VQRLPRGKKLQRNRGRWRIAEGSGAFRAGTECAEVVVAEDAGEVAVVEIDLDGVVADLRGGVGAGFWFIHRKKRRSGEIHRAHVLFFGAFVVTGGAGAVVAEIGEIVVAGVAVSPSDVNACAGLDVDFDGDGLFSLVEGCGHGEVISLPCARAFEKLGDLRAKR